MSKWYLSMKQFHRQCTKAHNFYLITQRYGNINSCLQNMEYKDRMQDYIVVRNHIKELQVQIDEIYGYKSETNKQIYEVIHEELAYCINQYPDYLMDLSIDEVSVHWCGYSKQQVGNPFHEYETITLQSNRIFMKQILKYTQSPPLMQYILDSDLKFLGENRYYKQKIFSAILDYSASKLKSLCDNPKVHLTYIHHSLDDTIMLYNENKNIPKQIEDQQTLSFYQIVPLPEQYLIKYMEKHSMQTLDNTGMSNGEELEYHSENQIEGQMENQIDVFGLKYEKVENFMEDQSCQQSTEQSKKEEVSCKRSQKQDIH